MAKDGDTAHPVDPIDCLLSVTCFSCLLDTECQYVFTTVTTGDLNCTEDLEFRARKGGIVVPHFVIRDKDKVESQGSISLAARFGVQGPV
jgi:hypothetical protein